MTVYVNYMPLVKDVHCTFTVYLSEILPVVEFVLEEGITDEEAIHLIQQSGGGVKDNEGGEGEEEGGEGDRWRQSDTGAAQALTLDSSPPQSPSHTTHDPFTANLMNFYVSHLLAVHFVLLLL